MLQNFRNRDGSRDAIVKPVTVLSPVDGFLGIDAHRYSHLQNRGLALAEEPVMNGPDSSSCKHNRMDFLGDL
jgi:hypothetical protein